MIIVKNNDIDPSNMSKITLVEEKSIFNPSIPQKNAICLLTVKPDERLLKLYDDLTEENYDFYVVLDDNNSDFSDLSKKYPKFNFIKIKEEDCIKSGFYKLNYYIKNGEPSAWEKAIYYFCNFKLNVYNYVWFFEDDVFIPDSNIINHIDKTDASFSIDFLSKKSSVFNRNWSHSSVVLKEAPKFIHKYLCIALVCAIRLSNKFLQFIKKYVDENKKMFFIESFLCTLTNYYNLKKSTITEFDNIVFKKNWTIYDIINSPISFIHPVKDINQQVNFRKYFQPNIKYFILNNPNKFINNLKNINAKFISYSFIQNIGFVYSSDKNKNKYIQIVYKENFTDNQYLGTEYFLENIDLINNNKIFVNKININSLEEGINFAFNLNYKYDYYQNVIISNYFIEKDDVTIKIINIPGLNTFVQFESHSSKNLESSTLFMNNDIGLFIKNYFDLFKYFSQYYNSDSKPFSNYEFNKLNKSIKYIKKNKNNYLNLINQQNKLYENTIQNLEKIKNSKIKIKTSFNFIDIN